MSRLSDTVPDIQRRMIDAYRRMSQDRKWRDLGADFVAGRLLHLAGQRLRLPNITFAEIRTDWLTQTLGRPPRIAMPDTAMTPQPFAPVLRHALSVFDRLGIGYAIGGSIASSLHGIGRMTRDADVTAEPFPGRENEFVAAFDPKAYYISSDAVQIAIRDQFSFNILHPESGFKIDVFILKEDSFEVSAFARRQFITLDDESSQPIAMYTAEDVTLFKLRWYRLGWESSEQQWNDILGVLRVQSGRLDDAYMDQWSAHLGVADLLARARGEA
jgi:hypothetical protein